MRALDAKLSMSFSAPRPPPPPEDLGTYVEPRASSSGGGGGSSYSGSHSGGQAAAAGASSAAPFPLRDMGRSDVKRSLRELLRGEDDAAERNAAAQAFFKPATSYTPSSASSAAAAVLSVSEVLAGAGEHEHRHEHKRGEHKRGEPELSRYDRWPYVDGHRDRSDPAVKAQRIRDEAARQGEVCEASPAPAPRQAATYVFSVPRSGAWPGAPGEQGGSGEEAFTPSSGTKRPQLRTFRVPRPEEPEPGLVPLAERLNRQGGTAPLTFHLDRPSDAPPPRVRVRVLYTLHSFLNRVPTSLMQKNAARQGKPPARPPPSPSRVCFFSSASMITLQCCNVRCIARACACACASQTFAGAPPRRPGLGPAPNRPAARARTPRRPVRGQAAACHLLPRARRRHRGQKNRRAPRGI